MTVFKKTYCITHKKLWMPTDWDIVVVPYKCPLATVMHWNSMANHYLNLHLRTKFKCELFTFRLVFLVWPCHYYSEAASVETYIWFFTSSSLARCATNGSGSIVRLVFVWARNRVKSSYSHPEPPMPWVSKPGPRSTEPSALPVSYLTIRRIMVHSVELPFYR